MLKEGRIALGLLLSLALLGCSDGETADSSSPNAKVHADGTEETLQPPSIFLPDSGALPLVDTVSFVPCDDADAHVGGLLQGSAELEVAGTERHCYIEEIDGDPKRYAGALVVAKGYDARSATIISVVDDGGTVVTVDSGLASVDSLKGTDRAAPGGGYAEFVVGNASGRVVRIREHGTLAMFFQRGADGASALINVTSDRSEDEVVAMARSLAKRGRG